MEDNWELARRQERAAEEGVCSFFIGARFQFVGVEPFVGILQDSVVRTVIFGQFYNPGEGV